MKFRRHLLVWLLALSSPLSARAVNEIIYDNPALTGQTLYFTLRVDAGQDEAGEYWDGNSWETITTTRADWDIPMTEPVAGSGVFVGNLPNAAAAYRKVVAMIYYDFNDDATPNHTADIQLAQERGRWDGFNFTDSGDPVICRTTVSAVTSQTRLQLNNLQQSGEPSYNGCTLIVRDDDNPHDVLVGFITAHSIDPEEVIFTPMAPVPFQIDAGDHVEIYPPSSMLDSHETLDSLTAFTVSVDNTEIIPTFVAKLGTRRDDVTIAWPVLNIREGEETPVWIDCSQLGGGRWIRSVANAASSDTGAFAIMQNAEDEDLVGVNRDHVVLWVEAVGDADDDDDDEANITCDVTFSSGQVVKAKLQLEVQGD